MTHAWKCTTLLLAILTISHAVPPVTVAVGELTSQGSAAAKIPLCPGLTIFTAINQPDGDYESIKTIESVTDQAGRGGSSIRRSAWSGTGCPVMRWG
jgi:hypothetical protein